MEKLEQLEQEIKSIKDRNKKVEADKSWETSLTRKILVAILTYAVIVIFFYFAQLPEPFLNAIVPTVGFMLSTLSIPFFKQIWIKYIYKK
jgi:preprotein translocase subunit SecF